MVRLLLILALACALLIILKFIPGSSSRADQNTSVPQVMTAGSNIPEQPPPVAGIPRDKAQAIVDRHTSEIMKVPGVYTVGLGDDGIHVGVTIHTQDQTKKPPMPLEIQALPPSIEKLPLKIQPLYILPPPLGVIVSRSGGKHEELDTCPDGFKEFVKYGWRFCFDPGQPDPIPTQVMVPPIAGITYEKALEILERHRAKLENLPGVESVGMGPGGISIHTNDPGVVPSTVEGLPIKTYPDVGPGHGTSHTETNPPIRPLHGDSSGRGSSPNSTISLRTTIGGIVLSDGKPWAIFPTHVLPGCITFPPCSFNPPYASLNTCPHNVVAQGTQYLSQPSLVTFPPLVGFAQMWDPDRASGFTTDVAAAFMDNDSNDGNGSLSADRKQELWTEIRGSNFRFTGLEVPPMVDETVYVVTKNLPHVMQAVITKINSNSIPINLDCSSGTYYLSNQMYLTGVTQFSVDDSGSLVLDGVGSVVGMFNWQVNADRRKGGGTQASTIRDILHFDAWYGTDTINDNTIGVFRPSSGGWVIDNGNGKYDGPGPCGPGVPTVNSDPCFSYGGWTDIPITGDWDGMAQGAPTNDVTVGVYRPHLDPNWFHLSNSNNPPLATINLATGPPSFNYKPVTGKWPGNSGYSNATTKVGVFRSESGGWFLDSGSNTISPCGTDYCFFLASGMYQAGDLPIAGDWNNDGIVSVGLFRRGNGSAPDYFFLSNVNPFTVRNNGTITSWDHATIPGGPGNFGYLPVIGNWTGVPWAGTAVDKLGVFRNSTGGWYLDNGNLIFPSCTEDQCPVFGSVGDKPVAFGKSIVKAN
jgi:hypothetical protein